MNESDKAKPVVFLGPSLPVSEAEAMLSANYLPPASQGSIVAAVNAFSPSAILLIDGVFQNEPAVRHKEILWAMAQGIPVFGAASMGALRAAELHRYGMIGVGLIFRWYRRFPLLPDDAVAVLHAPAEVGAYALTHSLIDLKMTIRAAERSGLLDHAAREKLESAARSLNFRERTPPDVIDQAFESSINAARRAELNEILLRSHVSQKKADAHEAIRLLANLQAIGALTAKSCEKFVMTNAFLRDLRHAGITLG